MQVILHEAPEPFCIICTWPGETVPDAFPQRDFQSIQAGKWISQAPVSMAEDRNRGL